MIQAICTLHLPFVEPRINRMTPNSPCNTAFLPQEGSLPMRANERPRLTQSAGVRPHSHILCLALRVPENYDTASPVAIHTCRLKVYREPRRIRTGPSDSPNESALRLYPQSPDLRLRHGGGTQGRQGALCGMWGRHCRSPPPTENQGSVVSPSIIIPSLRLLSRDTVSLSSLRYLATVPRLVTDPKLLNLPNGAALSFML